MATDVKMPALAFMDLARKIVQTAQDGLNSTYGWQEDVPGSFEAATHAHKEETARRVATQLEQYRADGLREAREALTAITQMDPDGVRADDLGRAARIAEDALRALKKENGDA